MKETFLRNYYSVGKTSAVRSAIHEFSLNLIKSDDE